jgi:hypothetical protein
VFIEAHKRKQRVAVVLIPRSKSLQQALAKSINLHTAAKQIDHFIDCHKLPDLEVEEGVVYHDSINDPFEIQIIGCDGLNLNSPDLNNAMILVEVS